MLRQCELYRHFNECGDLLYVGIAFNAMQRLRSHQNAASWYDQVTRIEIERFPTRAAAEEAELIAIEREKPLYNRVGEGRTGIASRSDEQRAVIAALIGEAKSKDVKISRGWGANRLRHAIDSAAKGWVYPYEGPPNYNIMDEIAKLRAEKNLPGS